MKQFPLKSTLPAALMLALTLTFSCSGGDDPDGGSSSPSGSSPSGGGNFNYGSVKDNNGKTYKTVQIGTQTWMAENLNYDVSGSVCYDNDPANCTTYGRLYDWSTAMALDASCNTSSCASQITTPHQGICPSGWHLPSNADWDKLMRYVDGTNGTSSPYASETAGRYLKATDGWYGNGNGNDQYGFSALPGGGGYSDGSFSNVGYFGFWWSSSASEDDSDYAYLRYMNYYHEYADYNDYYKDSLLSVRCVQD